jgi:SAM-dependent methyltransferase
MTQNIYDNPTFFAGYSKLGRSVEGLAGAAEWPSLRALVPDLHGKSVVDLGCGFGWFCRWAQEQGAASVLGIDVSAVMLARARKMTAEGETKPGIPPAAIIEYRRADLETLDLPCAAFDFAYSSLAFHYVEDIERLWCNLYAALRPGRRLVFSIEHPIYMAPTQPGWRLEADGTRIWPLNHYQMEGVRKTDWLAEGIVKQHRTLGTQLNLLIRLGFTIAHVEEWGPTDAQIAENPELAEECDRPMFLIVAVER